MSPFKWNVFMADIWISIGQRINRIADSINKLSRYCNSKAAARIEIAKEIHRKAKSDDS